MHSYHIFYFPFKWENDLLKGGLFSERNNLKKIRSNALTSWIQVYHSQKESELKNMYNEKNYYYPFVHPVLYDSGKKDSIVCHYEHKEPQSSEVFYIIATKGKTYKLRIDYLNLNLYSTGVGMLTFYLKNEAEDQKEPQDILNINQYGRRIFPPFFDDIDGKNETAFYIAIEGLNGNPASFREDFANYKNNFTDDTKKELKTWEPACFIRKLIQDLSDSISIQPIIDDRMFVNCWYGNDMLSKELGDDTKYDNFLTSYDNSFWYRYVFIDANDATCRNEKMKEGIIKNATYDRWQKEDFDKDGNRYYGAIQGVSKYSFVMLTDAGWFSKNILAIHMQTVYSRMVELILIQRASMLKFSEEITNESRNFDFSNKSVMNFDNVSSINESYMCFINQIYFREVTAQEQGIELYQMLTNSIGIEHQVKELEKEIEGLHQYVSLLDERTRNENSAYLNKIATIFLPATLIAGLFGMNAIENLCGADGEIVWWQFLMQLGIIGIICLIVYLVFIKKK